MMTEESFYALGCEITLSNVGGSISVANRRYMELFGVSPRVCSVIWNILGERNKIPFDSEPKHLLCGLLFLKSYPTETIGHIIMKMDEKTYHKWAWCFTTLMAMELPVVRLTSS
jgi:hypothetical protein